MARITYVKTADRPALKIWYYDDDGTLLDCSSGYTFSLKVGTRGSAAVLTKTTNITGAAGSGVEPTGTPNITVTWAAGELALTPGSYVAQLTLTNSSLDRVIEFDLTIVDVIT